MNSSVLVYKRGFAYMKDYISNQGFLFDFKKGNVIITTGDEHTFIKLKKGIKEKELRTGPVPMRVLVRKLLDKKIIRKVKAPLN